MSLNYYLENYKYDNVLSYLRDIHNADIADILQNLDPVFINGDEDA